MPTATMRTPRLISPVRGFAHNACISERKIEYELGRNSEIMFCDLEGGGHGGRCIPLVASCDNGFGCDGSLCGTASFQHRGIRCIHIGLAWGVKGGCDNALCQSFPRGKWWLGLWRLSACEKHQGDIGFLVARTGQRCEIERKA